MLRPVFRKSAARSPLALVPILVLVTGLFLGGCSDQPGDVGKGLLTAQDTLHLETRLSYATSAVAFLTRINGNSGRVLVGTYQDLEASTLVEFAGIPRSDSAVTIDSATIRLGVEYRFRDSTGEFGLVAHNMLRTWGTASFRWDSLAGAYDNAIAGTYLKTIEPSDTSVTFRVDTALIRRWSRSGTGSLVLMPSLTAQLVLGFSNTLSTASGKRPFLKIYRRGSADTTVVDSLRASRSIFVANSTFPPAQPYAFVQAGVDYPALLRFDSLALPPKVSVIRASLVFAIDEGASFLNSYSRDSLIAYLTRKDVYPYDSLILGVVCSPERVGGQKFYRADVKNIVQQWISREPNHGFAVHSYAEATTLDRFALYGANAPTGLRPKLTVDYTLFP